MLKQQNSTGAAGNTSLTAFYELESPIHDAVMAAQILAALMEDAHRSAEGSDRQIVMTEQEENMILFMVYDICRRTHELEKQFTTAIATKAVAS
ncbi:MAG: hypothetical protein Devi2KO_31650 [Devosia indica]